MAALLLMPIPGCDAVDFPPLVEPPPQPSVGVLHLHYVHGDSLRGDLQLYLRSWLAPGSAAEVLLDGRPVARVEGQAATDAWFEEAWTLPPDSLHALPQIMTIPDLAEELVPIPLPVLVREGSAVVCVGDEDPVFPVLEIAIPSTASSFWRFQLPGSDDHVVIQGQGPPPNALRIPRELLGPMPERRTADLYTSARTETEVGDAMFLLSADLTVQWTLVGNASGDPACPGSSGTSGDLTAGADRLFYR